MDIEPPQSPGLFNSAAKAISDAASSVANATMEAGAAVLSPLKSMIPASKSIKSEEPLEPLLPSPSKSSKSEYIDDDTAVDLALTSSGLKYSKVLTPSRGASSSSRQSPGSPFAQATTSEQLRYPNMELLNKSKFLVNVPLSEDYESYIKDTKITIFDDIEEFFKKSRDADKGDLAYSAMTKFARYLSAKTPLPVDVRKALLDDYIHLGNIAGSNVYATEQRKQSIWKAMQNVLTNLTPILGTNATYELDSTINTAKRTKVFLIFEELDDIRKRWTGEQAKAAFMEKKG